jgi:hypothetical protein
MSRTKPAASPFAQLLGLPPRKPPPAQTVTLVVAGKVVQRVDEVERTLVDDERDDDRAIAEARKLAAELKKARKRAADARYRAKPEVKERRKAWVEQNAERMAQYKADWRKRQGKKLAEMAAAQFKRRYYSDLEASRAAQRAYYHRNAERIKANAAARQAPGQEPQP